MIELNNEDFKKRNRTLSDDPQYFGGYLNMARLNIFNISNHVAGLHNQSILPEDGMIKNSFLCDKSNKKVNWNYAFSRTQRFLPLLKVFDFEQLPAIERESGKQNFGKDFSAMADTLKILFTEIQEFRNDYSHYFSSEKGITRKTSVSPEAAEFLKINLDRAIEYTKSRFTGVFEDSDYNLITKIQMTGINGEITTEGLVFLTSMFLEREYAFQFISKIKGLKGTQFRSFLATREVLMAFCLKLPHDKLISDDIKQSLAMDMLNELNRCPLPLYLAITEEARRKFIPELTFDGTQNIIDNSIGDFEDITEDEYKSWIDSLTKKVRYENRFHYFALRFIDENDAFDNFRFQINLGKLKIAEYQKSVGGETFDRSIVENPNVFGKLSDFTSEKYSLLQIDKDDSTLGFDPFAPCYNIVNNRIALGRKGKNATLINRISGKKIPIALKQPLPEAFLSLHELQKIILLEYFKKGEAERLINDFILINNNKLLTSEFIDEVKSKLPAEWNEFRRKTDSKKHSAYKPETLKYLKSRKETLNNVLAQYNLDVKKIPSRIVDYWIYVTDVDKKISFSDYIKKMKRDCGARLKALDKNKAPKIGEMATYLAKDIVDMIVNKEKKEKVTSFYYGKIQECIALFADPLKKQLFIDIVTNELKLNEAGGHPFLKNINVRKITYTSDFYREYLEEKGKKMSGNFDNSWLAKTFYCKEWDNNARKKLTIVKMPANKSNIPFTITNIFDKKDSDLHQWLSYVVKGKEARDRKKPVDLPVNLFDDTLINILKEELERKSVQYPPNANISKLMKIWWSSRGDDVQDFYKYERQYDVFKEIVRFVPDSADHFADYYKVALSKAHHQKQIVREAKMKEPKRNLPEITVKQVEKTFQKAIGTNEKEIRILQEEDIASFLIIEQLLGFGHDSGQKLKKVEDLLTENTAIKQTVPGKLSFDDNGEPIKNKEKPGITRTVTDNRKRKDFGALRKFVFDRRLPELFEYFEENELQLQKLKDELDAYNKAREIVFDTVFQLEKAIIEKHNETIKLLNTDDSGNLLHGNIPHKVYLKWLKNNGLIDEKEFTFLNMVRNVFSHNQFPQKSTMERIFNPQNEKIALQVATQYKQKIEDLIIGI